MIKNFLLVGVGGFVGSMLRYATSLIFKESSFPLATFVVNIVGSFFIGWIVSMVIKNPSASSQLKLLWATGLCGGFTTFSAFTAEGIHLLQQQRYTIFLLYFTASILLGLAAAWAGMALAK
jgi:fluoride exporter